MSEPILIGESVRKVYHTGAEEVEALRDVDITVATGEFVAVMGPSGSGKTTLLNCCSGLDEIDGGRVIIEGESIHELPDARRTRHRASTMGFIFQAFNLIPVFTALENVELPLLLAGVKEGEARKRALDTLERVGLGARVNHRPSELSGGEQQRVTIARALAGRPRIVWADEPTGNLDSETAGTVIGLLHELNADGLTLVLVTHDQTVAAGAHRTVLMRDGQVVAETSRQAEERAAARARGGKIAAAPAPATAVAAAQLPEVAARAPAAQAPRAAAQAPRTRVMVRRDGTRVRVLVDENGRPLRRPAEGDGGRRAASGNGSVAAPAGPPAVGAARRMRDRGVVLGKDGASGSVAQPSPATPTAPSKRPGTPARKRRS